MITRKYMVSLLVFWIPALWIPGGFTPAQSSGSHRGLFIGYANIGTAAASAVGNVDPSNRLTSFTSSTNGAWPHWGNVWGAAVDMDNHQVLLPALIGLTNPPSKYGLVGWDPGLQAVTRTLWTGPFNTGMPRNLTNFTLNSDGNPVSYDSVLGWMMEFEQLSGTWSGTRIPVPNNAGLGGFVWDKIGGGYVYANARNVNVPSQTLLRTSPDRRVTTTLATTNSATLHAGYGGDLLQNGDWISSADAGFLYLEVKAGSNIWQTGPSSPRVMWDVTAEKFAAPGRGYYASIVSSPQQVVYVDATTTPHTITILITSATTRMPSWILETLPLFDRDLCTRRTGKATWDLLINPGCGSHAGKAFVVAASLAGARPAAQLPDGREIFLLPDPLTDLSVRGLLFPFLTGNLGELDPSGRGVARINLGQLGTAANAMVVHFAGVILDTGAPSGIAWVLDPWAFVVDVKS